MVRGSARTPFPSFQSALSLARMRSRAETPDEPHEGASGVLLHLRGVSGFRGKASPSKLFLVGIERFSFACAAIAMP